MTRQIATFRVGDALLGIDILLVKEVYRHMTLTPIPGAPPQLGGLMNLRGRVVTVIDLNVCLELPQQDAESKRLLIMKTGSEILQYQRQGKIEEVELGEDIVGFLIDRMEEVLTIQEEDVLPAPPNLAIIEKKLIDGVVKLKDHIVILIDVSALLDTVISVSTALSNDSTN